MQVLLKTAFDVSWGMAYLHMQCKVIHGDLNCNNVLLDCDLCAKVADFGLTQYFDGNTRATSVLGTVTHMSPEMLGEGKVNFKGDVYSFGVMLWEMYTGERAWAGLRQAQIMLAKMDRLSAPLKIPEDCPAPFTDLLESCMAYEYKNRPEFKEICYRLQGLMQYDA
jgi:serine/threonine protein kinase